MNVLSRSAVALVIGASLVIGGSTPADAFYPVEPTGGPAGHIILPQYGNYYFVGCFGNYEQPANVTALRTDVTRAHAYRHRVQHIYRNTLLQYLGADGHWYNYGYSGWSHGRVRPHHTVRFPAAEWTVPYNAYWRVREYYQWYVSGTKIAEKTYVFEWKDYYGVPSTRVTTGPGYNGVPGWCYIANSF